MFSKGAFWGFYLHLLPNQDVLFSSELDSLNLV